jgi:hypothetical protein
MTPDNTEHPFAVWELTGTGRVLRTFPDEYLAMQFVVNNGGKVIANPINH